MVLQQTSRALLLRCSSTIAFILPAALFWEHQLLGNLPLERFEVVHLVGCAIIQDTPEESGKGERAHSTQTGPEHFSHEATVLTTIFVYFFKTNIYEAMSGCGALRTPHLALEPEPPCFRGFPGLHLYERDHIGRISRCTSSVAKLRLVLLKLCGLAVFVFSCVYQESVSSSR